MSHVECLCYSNGFLPLTEGLQSPEVQVLHPTCTPADVSLCVCVTVFAYMHIYVYACVGTWESITGLSVMNCMQMVCVMQVYW